MSATVTTVIEALNIVIALSQKAAEVSAAIAKAQAEGRTTLTADEWSAILASDDAAIKGLTDAIAQANVTAG